MTSVQVCVIVKVHGKTRRQHGMTSVQIRANVKVHGKIGWQHGMTSVQVCAIVQVQTMKPMLGGNEAGRLLKFLAPFTRQRQASCEQIARDLLLIILLGKATF